MGAEVAGNRQREAAPLHSHPLDSFRNALRIATVASYAGGSVKRFRSLRLSGIMLAASGVASVFLVRSLGAGDVADVVALRIVAYACWLYGALGLWALLSPEALDGSGLLLLKMRGRSSLPFRSQALGITRHLFFGMILAGMPGVIAAAIISPTIPSLLQRIGLILVSILYLLSLALLLGALGTLSARSAPKSPRRMALALIIAPFLASFMIEDVPSIPGFYSWLLGEMIAWGGGLS